MTRWSPDNKDFGTALNHGVRSFCCICPLASRFWIGMAGFPCQLPLFPWPNPKAFWADFSFFLFFIGFEFPIISPSWPSRVTCLKKGRLGQTHTQFSFSIGNCLLPPFSQKEKKNKIERLERLTRMATKKFEPVFWKLTNWIFKEANKI